MRKILRNIMKTEAKTNKIGGMWRDMQIRKYGRRAWSYMYFECGRKTL